MLHKRKIAIVGTEGKGSIFHTRKQEDRHAQMRMRASTHKNTHTHTHTNTQGTQSLIKLSLKLKQRVLGRTSRITRVIIADAVNGKPGGDRVGSHILFMSSLKQP